MRIVFMGSPVFAVPALEALVEARHEVRLVVTQPDREAGRGRKLEPTAVKRAAGELGLPLLEFGRGDRERVTGLVLAAEPEAIVVAAFGHILREPLLSTPVHGCINVHASLLPRWRGVSPVQYAILHGDAWTGVTIMRMDPGVDTGPILAQRAVPIHPEETAGELAEKLSGHGADLLVYTLRRLAAGRIVPQPQGESGAVYAPKLTRSLAPLRWDRPVTIVHNQVRALRPYPGATSFLGERLIKVASSRPYGFRVADAAPGTIIAVEEEGLAVACGEGVLLVTALQSPGRRELPVAEFIRGHEVQAGQVFHS